MAFYVDSSVLISILKNDAQAPQAEAIWSQQTSPVSSVLLEAECVTVLRRTYPQFKKEFPENWLKIKEEGLALRLAEVELKMVDEEVMDIIRTERRLAPCRSLDAIHVATALLFQQASPNDFTFFTFDERQAAVAKAVGLKFQS